MKKFLLVVALFFVTICSFAHVYEIRVNQAQDGSLTWYLITYHGVNECGHDNAGLTINGVNYPIDAEFAGDGALLSPNVFATIGFSFVHASYATVHTPFLGTTISVAPYSNNVCWAFAVGGSGNFTPPPPPVCTSCPITSWTNVMASSGNNNGTLCNTSDDVTTATIKVNHLSCASITGTGQFSVIYNFGGTNVAYGPYSYTAGGIETDVTVNVPYGATNSTQVQVVDYSYPCNITHGLTIPGGQYLGEKETTPPSITCPGAQTICTNILPDYRSSAVVSDNCSASNNIVVTQSPAAGSTVSGAVTVTLTATDQAGNQSSCNFAVTAGDTQKPTITCPANQTLNLDASCSATLPDYRNLLTVSDNCTATGSLVITQSPAAGTVVTTKGAIIVTFTVTDAAGNSNTCNISVDKKDVTAPVISCPASQTVNNNTNVCGAVATFSIPTATDNCSGSAFNFFNPGEPNNSGSEDNLQLYTSGTWNDLNGGNSLFFIVEINSINPNAISGYTRIGTLGGHTYYISTFTQSWNAARASAISIGGDLASINTLAESTFLAPYGGNTWVGGYQDHSDPSYVEPGNASQNFGGWKWVDGTKLGAGQITITQTAGLASGATFPIGVTTNTFTATDESGNTSACSFTVTVIDNQKPTISCPSTITHASDASVCTYSFTPAAPSASDNCPGVTVSGVRSDALALNAPYPFGNTTITWTAKDASSNTQSCTQTITVTDNEKPVILNLPASFSVNALNSNCANIVSWTRPTATDNCAIASFVSSDPFFDAAGYTFLSVGVTTVTYTATDVHGNVTTASFTVTVVDNQPPFLTGCPSNITVNAAAGRCDNTAIWNPPTASDNCPGVSLTTNHISGETFPVGTTVVTYTATDHAGLSVSCSFNVTVVDTQLPVITCGGPISVTNDAGKCGATVTVATPSATDNCPGVTVAGVRSDALALNALYPVGTTTITWTATDAHSNTATCTQTITVTDNEFPVINCAGTITHTANTGLCSYSFTPTAPTATDNCPGVTVAGVRSDAQPLTAAYPVGTTTITWTASDVHSHSITCTQAVTITDDENPVITCPSNITHTADAGVCTYSFTPTAATATDNCPGVTVTGTRSDALALNAPYPSGTTTITWTATDAHAHIVTCMQTITVTDNEKPTIVCAPAQTVNLDANCSAVLPDYRSLLTISDNCTPANALSVTQSPAAGTALNGTGSITVTFTVTDASANSNTCSITVTKKDVTPPVIVCVAPITVNTDANVCGAVVTFGVPTATDNCTAPGGNLTFNYTGSMVTWTVPSGVTAVTVKASGAQGADGNYTNYQRGGKGGYAQGNLTVTPGETLWLAVGGQGSRSNVSPALGGFNGGGNGYNIGNTSWFVAGGGGATDIRRSGSALSNRVIVAAGGGGAGGSGSWGNGDGGNGGGLTGVDGHYSGLNGAPMDNPDINRHGKGGTQTGGGAGGTYTGGVYGTFAGGSAGTLGQGGNSDIGNNTLSGGGGGGYYGGGGGSFHGGAGGGGSSYIGGVTAGATTAGLQSGNGTINISWGGVALSVVQTAGLPSGSVFPVGTTTNTFVATDASGNTATCSFNVTVTDNQKPVITTNGNKSVNNDAGTCGAAVTVSATATDNCGVGTPTGVRSDALALTAPYPVGATTITWTVTDINGNAAVAVTQTVTVTDNQIPVITTNGNKSVNSDAGTCGAVVAVSATATDNCGVGAPTGMRSDALALTAPYPVGTTTITWTVTDIHGNAATPVVQTIVVTDNQIPVIATNGDKSVNSDAGACGAVVAVSATATDNCGVGAPTGMRSDALALTAPYPVGTTTITWTVTDIHGNAAAAVTQTITVTDNEIPVITSNGNQSVNNDAGNCGAVVAVSATATDNCGVGAPIGVRSDALALTAPYPVGTTTITWTVTDIHGNAAVAVTQTVTVTDNEKPVITSNGNQSVNNDAGNCSALVAVSAAATDNCGVGAPAGMRSDALALTAPYPVGTTTITWTVTDIHGNAATPVVQTIVVTDNQIPVITTNGNKSVNSDPGTCGAVVSVSATATDNCGVGAPAGMRNDALALTAPYPVGTTTITWTVTDIHGNAAVAVTQTVTVTDNQFPVLVGVPANVTVECDAVPAPAVVSATDNCGTSVPSFTELRTNGNCPSNYTLTRTWSTTDASNNTTTATQVITVRDTKAPVLSAAPAAVTVECDAVPAPATLTATDNCDAAPVVTYTQTRTNGACANSYTLTRKWTATDACGNACSKTQVITVLDRTAPVLSAAPAAVTVECDAVPAPATLTATDNCDAAPVVTYAQARTNGACANSYTLTRTWTATDACGNASSKSQVITVLDRTAPVLSAAPAAVTVECDAVPAPATLTATDNCDANPVVTYAQTRTNGACANSYTLTRTWTATDACGNASSKSQVITVLDRTVPVLSAAPAAVTVECDAVPAPATLTATDNCDAAPVVTYAQTRTNGTSVNDYTLTRTWTATDACGNASSKTQTITVRDTKAPVLTVPSAISVNTDNNVCGATVGFTATATDNCGPVTITYSQNPATLFALGTTVVTVTAKDASGNTTVKTFTVTVTDRQPATVVTKNITIALSASGSASIAATDVNNGSSDACGIATISVSPSTFTCANVGANTVTLTVTDVNGNVSTGTAVVTVVDNTAPVVVTQNISVNLAANGTVSITPAQINNGSSDVCGIKTITVSPNTFTCANLGTNTVTLTVTDVNGNVSTGTAVVTVKDNIAPTAITKNITVALNGSGQATVVPSQVDNGSNDNCSVALSFQCASAGGQNLFSNGDFGSGFTGWSVSNVDNSGGWIATGGNPTGYYLLNSNGAVATDPTIQQTVTGLVPGQWYTISGQRNNIENGAFGNAAALSFGVAVDNTVILQLANTGKATWIPFSVQFKATATSHVIAFSAERNGDDTQYGVDNLSVVASPPASCTTGSIVFNCSNIGVNTVKLVVTDPSGNTATQTATVTVVDNLAPVITLPANATVNCGTSTAPSATGTATAADNCSTATVTYSDVTAGNVITRTWKAVDVYGNTSTAVQTITIVDNIKPVVVNPADITVTCSTLTSPSVTGTATATDNCGTPVVTYSDTWYNSTTLLRFWKATDGFGNVSNIINAQTITINDNIKPVITDVPDITVNCGASTLPSATGTATATDNCGTPTVTYSDVTSGNIITRTWKATDGFGNTATSTQVITVGAVFTATVSSVPTSSTYTGGVSTNLYLGYGAQSTTLQMGSLPSGGAPYTYVWSGSYTNKLNSTTAASPVFTPATFGYYTFNVTVTNKYGCTTTATINICVTDIRVAGGSGKVYVCHAATIGHTTTYTTLQVTTSQVPGYIYNSCTDKLGSCDQSACNTTVSNSIVTNSSGTTKEGTTEATGSDELKVTVMPNPTNTFFTLKLESKYETPVSMRVMDANGRVIDAKSKIGANSTIQIGHNYSSGTYYAELIQGTQRKVVQMVKGR